MIAYVSGVHGRASRERFRVRPVLFLVALCSVVHVCSQILLATCPALALAGYQQKANPLPLLFGSYQMQKADRLWINDRINDDEEVPAAFDVGFEFFTFIRRLEDFLPEVEPNIDDDDDDMPPIKAIEGSEEPEGYEEVSSRRVQDTLILSPLRWMFPSLVRVSIMCSRVLL